MNYFVNQLLRIRRRWYIVVAITLVTVLGAFVAGVGDRTTYSAKAALSASSPTSENTPYALALAYIYLFNDPSFQDALNRKAKVPAGVTSTAEPATVGSIFYIDATASTPEAARSAASALATTFRTEINGALEDAKKQTITSVEAPFEERYAQRLEVPGDERANLQEQINTINANTNGMINSVGLDSAVTASAPQRGTTLLTALGGGLVVGLLMALGVDIASRRVRSGFDVTDKTAYTTALVVADPDDGNGSARAADLQHLSNRVMSGSDSRPHVIAVVAAQSGASAAARQLAETMASALGTAEVPALLVRTDARRSVGAPASRGFVDALVDADLDLAEVMSAESGGVCTIDVGNRVLDPIGVITRTSVARFLDAARKQAEVVLLEAPIIVESPEAQIICAQADVVITVVDPATATVSDVSDTYRLLAEVRAQIGPAVVMSAPPVRAPVIPARLTQVLTDEIEDTDVTPRDHEPDEVVTDHSVAVVDDAVETATAADVPGRSDTATEIDDAAETEDMDQSVDADHEDAEPVHDIDEAVAEEPETVEAVADEAAALDATDAGEGDASQTETTTEAGDMDEAAETVTQQDPVPTPPAPPRPALRSVATTPPAETAISKAIRRANRWRQESAARRTPPTPRPRVTPQVAPTVAPRDDMQPHGDVEEEFLPYRSLRAPIVEPEPAAEATSHAEPAAEVESEPVAELEPVAEVTPEPEVEPVAEVELELAAEVTPEPTVEVEPEPVAEVEPEVVDEVEPEPEPVAQVESEPVAEVEPEPVSEVEPEPLPTPIVEAPDAPLVPASAGEDAVPTDQFPAMGPVVGQVDPFALERHAAAKRAAHEEFLREQVVRQRWERELVARRQWVHDQQVREQEARDRRAQEELERRAAIQERLARQQRAREEAAREEARRREHELAERERVERLERERIARERAELLQLERIERARAAHLERERAARAEAARRRLAEEQRQREERAAVERAVAARLTEERLAAQRLEEERREIERQLEAERVAREQAERELALQQQVARERMAQDQWAQYRLAQERWLEEQWSRYRAEQQQWLQQRAAGIDVPPPSPPSPNAVPQHAVRSSVNGTTAPTVTGGPVVEGTVERRSDAHG
ncbi:hypothetical protein [uncultured Williamsia sp.]|uniref:hypothetical protein n=1 Tax=uncultured Williamsia sp. TaxID=259311 RepID=UPI0026322EA7|nr:hypothetical protein [uncultured Williamsia sp.]